MAAATDAIDLLCFLTKSTTLFFAFFNLSGTVFNLSDTPYNLSDIPLPDLMLDLLDLLDLPLPFLILQCFHASFKLTLCLFL